MWDYPRPPRLEATTHELVVEHAGTVIARTTRGARVLETSQPPAYYFPPGDVRDDLLRPSTHRTFCEWKGTATYLDVVVGDIVATAAVWRYERPHESFASIAGWLAFYPQRVDACSVDGERATAVEGAFYGGWVTSAIVGPFKGGVGTAHW